MATMAIAACAAASSAQAGEGKDWSFEGAALSSTQDFRDIDVKTFEISKTVYQTPNFEVRAGGGLFAAEGERTDLAIIDGGTSSQSVPAPSIEGNSDALGITAGATARLYPITAGNWRFFAGAKVQALWTSGDDFPYGGTEWNALLEGDAGAEYRFAETTAVEFGYRTAVASNFKGGTKDNPRWAGEGAFLAVKRTF
jgi:hypothetical protein